MRLKVSINQTQLYLSFTQYKSVPNAVESPASLASATHAQVILEANAHWKIG